MALHKKKQKKQPTLSHFLLHMKRQGPKEKKKNFTHSTVSFKKIIALYVIVSPICPLWGERLTSPNLRFKQVSGRVMGRSGSGPVRGEDISSSSLDPASRERAQTRLDPARHSVSSHTFSVQVSLSILMIALTLERPTVQMHTHTFQSHTC